jgi:hypothetical protein
LYDPGSSAPLHFESNTRASSKFHIQRVHLQSHWAQVCFQSCIFHSRTDCRCHNVSRDATCRVRLASEWISESYLSECFLRCKIGVGAGWRPIKPSAKARRALSNCPPWFGAPWIPPNKVMELEPLTTTVPPWSGYPWRAGAAGSPDRPSPSARAALSKSLHVIKDVDIGYPGESFLDRRLSKSERRSRSRQTLCKSTKEQPNFAIVVLMLKSLDVVKEVDGINDSRLLLGA